MRRHGASELSFALALLGLGSLPAAVAQDAEVPRAPRIIDVPQTSGPAPSAATRPAPAGTAVGRPPNAARLAPLPEERQTLDEIIVVGQGWRLPDLGSEWRARQEEAAETGRFTALPLYDPARPPQRAESFVASPEQRRQGYVELFRLRFGKRARNRGAEDAP